MDWTKLKENKCPSCNGDLVVSYTFTTCSQCDFKIRNTKLGDLQKGKESTAYKAKVKKYQDMDKRAKKNKQKNTLAKSIQDSERVSNLKRMLAKGEITQEEYDRKI